MIDFKNDIRDYLNKIKDVIDIISDDEINEIMNVLVSAYNGGKQVFIMGNGGSAATASHFVCDFNKGVSLNKDKKFKFLCLNDNAPSLLAYANDLTYDVVFVEQLKTYFNEGDCVIGISGSGNSKNIIKAIEYANVNKGITIGLTGFDGGMLKGIAQHSINIPINDMQITEDLHIILDHLMMKILTEKL